MHTSTDSSERGGGARVIINPRFENYHWKEEDCDLWRRGDTDTPLVIRLKSEDNPEDDETLIQREFIQDWILMGT